MEAGSIIWSMPYVSELSDNDLLVAICMKPLAKCVQLIKMIRYTSYEYTYLVTFLNLLLATIDNSTYKGKIQFMDHIKVCIEVISYRLAVSKYKNIARDIIQPSKVQLRQGLNRFNICQSLGKCYYYYSLLLLLLLLLLQNRKS